MISNKAVGDWFARAKELHAELSSLADPAPWWWLVAGGVAAAEALPQPSPPTYLACDAEPDADTLVAYRSPRPHGLDLDCASRPHDLDRASRPHDLVIDAIVRARAARTAIRELDGTLPDQPLAVTLDGPRGARLVPSSLDIAAFAFGDHVRACNLDDPNLESILRRALSESRTSRRGGQTTIENGSNMEHRGRTPFVCVSMGDEPLETARHGHRRAWTDHGGPWLGLGRAGDVAIVSTCHLVVDGYGHARLAARIAELTDHIHEKISPTHFSSDAAKIGPTHFSSPLRTVRGAVPLSIAWREIEGDLPRVIPLAYRLGCILHRDVGGGRRGTRFSPTIQVPVALGAKDDPVRLRRRVVAASINVRFDERGEPESFAAFEARVRGVFAREAAGRGLVSRLLAAARGIPAPVRWKRGGISAKRPAWLEGFADVIGGRALLSRISIDTPIPLSYAVSSPSRMASDADPIGSCVLSLVDDGTRGAITLSGSGELASDGILDELLGLRRSTRTETAGRVARRTDTSR